MKHLRVIICTLLLIAVLVLVCGFCSGMVYSQSRLYPLLVEQNEVALRYYNSLNIVRGELRMLENKTPRTIMVEVPIEIIKEVEVIKEVPIEVIREVEVIKYRHITAREWESVEQFTQWHDKQDFRVLMPSSVYKVDCDDYSVRLQRIALQQGYPVSEALSKNGLYGDIAVNEINGLHAGNLVLIGSTYYWVEPQPNMFTVKKIYDRD